MKYETEGGPTLEDCFTLLDKSIRLGVMAGKNKITLLHGVIFNFLIGNGDAHGKNFSLLYDGGAEALAPFYDLMSTVVYSNSYKAKMAMKISGKYRFRDVSARHWEQFATILGFRSDFVKKQITLLANDTCEKALNLCKELNKSKKTTSPIYKKIIAVITNNKQQITNFGTKTQT